MTSVNLGRMELNPVSRKLIWSRYLARIPFLVIVTGFFAWAGFQWSQWWHIGTAIVGLFTLWQLYLVPSQVPLIGWKETDDEFLITKGKVWHTFTVVPYGRIQYVDVTAGPIDGMFGLKTVTLNTASASSDSSVEGLPNDVADALRDRLSVKARERMSGL